MLDQKAIDYLAGLPQVETARLPQGTLFWAENRIYEVTETDAGGYHKARLWRNAAAGEVALIPGSIPSKHLPLVKTGHVLPIYRSRLELADGDQPACYVFPSETLALDAAYLDVALVQSSGAYVRKHNDDPAFTVTDGVHAFRLYYFRETVHGRPTDLRRLQVRPLPFQPQPHSKGPLYWRLLPSWTERIAAHDVTREITVPTFDKDDTLPHIPDDDEI